MWVLDVVELVRLVLVIPRESIWPPGHLDTIFKGVLATRN